MVGLFEETQITKYLDVVETGLGSYGRLKIDMEQKHEVFYFLSSLAFFLLIGKELENIHYIWMLLSFSIDNAFASVDNACGSAGSAVASVDGSSTWR